MTRSKAFTLFELLLVMSIIVILVGFTVPMVTLTRSIALSQEMEWLGGELKKARQTAIAENRTLEVRLYSYTGLFSDEDQVIRAVQILKREDSGEFRETTALHQLEDSVIISEDPSITRIGPPVTPTADDELDLPSGYNYRAFQYRPDGSTNLDLSEKWYFTMHLEKETGSPPSNFATFQIEPLTGAVNIYRP